MKEGILYKIELFKNKFTKKPIKMLVETSNLCNINCESCPTPRRLIKRERKNMAFSDFRKIIDNSKDIISKVILHWTNEPLTNPELPDFIRYCKNQGLKTYLSTNGILLNKKVSKELIKSGLNEIDICLDGMSRESYKYFRGVDKFEIVENNIEEMVKIRNELNSKILIKLQFIITKKNESEIKEFEEYCKKLKVNYFIKTFALVKVNNTEEERERLFKKFLPNKTNLSRYNISHELKRKPKRCNAPYVSFAVTVDGDIVPCCFDFQGNFIYGNIIKDKLSEILKSEKAIRIRKLGYERKLEVCKLCL